MTVDRRAFLKAAALGAGITVTGGTKARGAARPRPPDVVVVGAGAFGMWTALHLQRRGASVRVVDLHGPANSRATSGGETRGVRTSYGDRPHGLFWGRWARLATERWLAWDAEHRDSLLPRLFFQTGDLIMREESEPYLEDTRANWDALGIRYEVLTPEDITHRWPWIRVDRVGTALYEPDAGVVRARRAIESVATVFQRGGGTITIGRAAPGNRSGDLLETLTLERGDPVVGGHFVFACGPWFPGLFPDVLGGKIRTPIGHTFYFGIPPGDNRYMHPNMPSYGVPGCTGWPGLSPDLRGFRVRTGGRPVEDPDYSDRWIPPEHHRRPRQVLADYFPDLVGAPVMETRACHYESSVTQNFIIDRHPGFANVWLAGGGSAEAFKFGPVLGEYIAGRVLGEENPEVDDQFRIPEESRDDDER